MSRAYELFWKASECPQSERESFLAASAESPEIRAQAAAMLRDWEHDETIELPPAVALPEWARDRIGTFAGDWRVEESLGFGGFGRVYRASRRHAEGKDGEMCAIKFLDISPNEIPRFRAERQRLADLDHEGICKFVDGGATPGGVPYLVMEYVHGLPIDQYCDLHELTLTSRLRLFGKVCCAVEHAHEHRILHRDLKPANILVTTGGAVKILDFGVSKLLDPQGRGTQQFTRLGEFPWTREYASPEQVNGRSLGTASDVYSLGVILYQLVTGELPLPPSALHDEGWMRVIAEREPLPPSQAVLAAGSPAEFIGGLSTGPGTSAIGTTPKPPGLSPRRRCRELKGDLDAVILKALRKDEDHRYRSVDALRAELEAFLKGAPVATRRSRWWERASALTRRRPISAAVIATSMLWVALQFGMMLWREVEAVAAMFYEQDAARQLRFMTETALPRVEGAIPRDRSTTGPRLTAARIHTSLLQKAEALHEPMLQRLDSSLAASALDCAGEWQALGDPQAGLNATTPVLARIADRYRREPHDQPWKELYLRTLRQRIELFSLLQQDTEAAATHRRLVEIEGGRL